MTLPQISLDPWQFRVTRARTDAAIPFGPMFLEVGPDIHLNPVKDKTGTFVGYLLGFTIDLTPYKVLEQGDVLIADDAIFPDIEIFVESLFERLSGRFLFLLDDGAHLRAYPDGFAQVPCVFDPELKIAGSTAHALLDDAAYQARFNRDLYTSFDVAREGWFPAGLTAHQGIERVLPNHFLDFITWETKRHWPREEWEVDPDPETAVKDLIENMRGQVGAITRSSKGAIQALTAGRETRTLLACVKPIAQDIQFVTVTGGGRYQTDSVMARSIASAWKLKFRELDVVEADEAQMQLYMRRGAHCVGGHNIRTHPSIWPLAQDYYFIGGLGGEVARGFLWRTSDTADMELRPQDIIARLGLPATADLIQRLEHWLTQVPTKNALWILDLAYIEHRMGPWGSAQFYCDPTLVRLSPMVNRRTLASFLRLPDDWKRSHHILKETVRREAPDLARLPYNSLGLFQDSLSKIRRALDNPRVILKKIRKKLG